MSDTWYFFYQMEAKSTWTLALASERDRINQEVKPELNTVLDVNCSFDTDMSSEDYDKVKYKGPMYFDFDSQDLEEVIPEFQQLLTNLKAKGCNLNALRLYASGGKGFHIEMPATMLMAKVPPHGIQSLPLIYREVAHELFVNTLDLRVYSTKKGRQWRCPNVKRTNGNHKVQITVDEAMSMTPDLYHDLIKHPRPLFPVEDAVFTPDLALIYSKAREKVDKALNNRKKRKKQPDELARFKGDWPETLRTILQGQGLKDKVGWNYLCVQLAVTADALGKTEDQLLEDAQVLIESYAGDSERYGTVAKRKLELRNKFRYFSGNPCYEFSVGGVLSLVDKGTAEVSDLNLGEYVPEEGEEEEKEGAEEGSNDADLPTKQVRINSHGMFSRTDFGWKNICHVGLHDPVLLMMPDGKHVGYDVEVLVNSKSKGRHMLDLKVLATKASLHNFAMTFNASFRGTDMDAAHTIDLMRHKVESKSNVSLVTQVEGIDLILPPEAKSEEDLEIIWSSVHGVVTTGKHRYTFKPLNTQSGTYQSDLYNAQTLSNSEEDRQMIRDLLRINSPHNLARILGWFGATFLCPVLRRHYSQFPLLQIYGSASAGKSKTIALVSHMYYNLQKPKIVQASGMTKYPVLAAVSSSCSIPLVIEEMRARLMRAGGMWEFIINTMKSNYDGHDMARGSLGSDKGSAPVVNDYANTAPICFTAEEQNGEVAIQERSVMVCMTKGDREGRKDVYERLLARATNLGRLGKAMLLNALALNIPAFLAEFNEVHNELVDRLGPKAEGRDRPVYNLAVTLIGLRFMHAAIKEAMGDEFDEEFSLMSEVVLDHVEEFVPQNMSESARVLDTLAQLTKIHEIQFKLERNRDYTVDEAAMTVDIKLKPAYAKYMKYIRSLGLQPLFENDAAFIAAMNRYEGTVQRACPDSAIFDNPFEAIFRFSIQTMERDGIEPFKP